MNLGLQILHLGEEDREGSAAARQACGLNSSLVRLGNPTTEPETQAGGGTIFRRKIPPEKTVKDLWKFFLRNARARILNGKTNLVFHFVNPGHDDTSRGRVPDRILEKVGDESFQKKRFSPEPHRIFAG